MLFFEAEPFDSDDYLYELKFDGARCLAYLDYDKTTLINKRHKDISLTYPELSDIHQLAKKRCIIDGELIVMANGKPDFYQLQKRALVSNPFKVKLLSKNIPVSFIAFDILFLEDKLLVDLPLIERKKILHDNIVESNKLIISRFIEGRGIDFFDLAQKQHLEGIVAKEKQSKYYLGKRSRVWLKIKVFQEDDLIICGYIQKINGVKDLILARYQENNLTYAASVATAKDKKIISEFANKNPSEPLFPLTEEGIIWMQPFLVCTVKYMMKTKHGGLRQAIYKGLRDDITADDLKKLTP